MYRLAKRPGALSKTFRITFLAAALAALTACGGGSSTSATDLVPVDGGYSNPDMTDNTDTGTGGGTTDGGSTGGTGTDTTDTVDGGTGTDTTDTVDGGTDTTIDMGGDTTDGTTDGTTDVVDGGNDVTPTITVTVNWEAPTSNVDGTVLNDLAGYRIYWGTAPGVYTHSSQVADPSATSLNLTNPAPGTYYFAATAYDSEANESPYSNVTSVVIN